MNYMRLLFIFNLFQFWMFHCEAHDFSFSTIQGLEQTCKKANSPNKLESMVFRGLCTGYFSGILQIRFLLHSLMGQEPFPCVPNELTSGQATKIFLKWTERHPESLHLHPMVGVLKSLGEAFKCEIANDLADSNTLRVPTPNNRFHNLIKIITFNKGESSTVVSSSVIKGNSDLYLFGANNGQKMKLNLISPEGNALVQIYEPAFEIKPENKDVINVKGINLEGTEEAKAATKWEGTLNKTGNYLIVVRSPRENSSYSLNLEIK